MIQTLKNMLRCCVLDLQGSWEEHLHVDCRKRDLEFQGGRVFLKVSCTQGVKRFGMTGKLKS